MVALLPTRGARAQQPAAEPSPGTALVAQANVERLPADDSDSPAAGSSTDDRLRKLELRLEEQRAISEGLRLDFERRLAAPPPARTPERPPYVVGTMLGMVPIWNNGLEFRSLNKDYYFHIGGRTQLDFVDLSSPNPDQRARQHPTAP